MEKVRYLISDAAEIVHVESHVLRYWEEELNLKVPRNEMGHRYYTKENIEEFQRIKELKEKGYQLKAIRMFLHHGEVMDLGIDANTDRCGQAVRKQDNQVEKNSKQELDSLAEINHSIEQERQMEQEHRLEQFRDLMTEIVGQAIRENNPALGQVVGEQVQERVLKEMNYLAQEQEQYMEERYRKLDEAIRGQVKKHKLWNIKEELIKKGVLQEGKSCDI